MVKDKLKKHSLGYGFITCNDKETVERLKHSEDLYFLGRKLDIGNAAQSWESDEVKLKLSLRKVFVAGLTPSMTESKRVSAFATNSLADLFSHFK